jgi:fatty-acyl-CoA synthase
MASSALTNPARITGHGAITAETEPESIGAEEAMTPLNGLSHVTGASEPPLRDITIPALLDEAAALWPAQTAVVFREQKVRLSWAELRDACDRLAAGFIALGIKPGDRVGIWSQNRIEWVLTMFAAARIGAILVNVNPAYRLAELEYALNKVGCVALVTAAKFKTSDYLAMLRALAPELADAKPGAIAAGRLPHLKTIIRMEAADVEERTPGMFGFDQVMAMATTRGFEDARNIGRSLAPADAINIQFTSGTTGNPKGATLTHRNIVNNARFVAHAMRFTEADRLCIPVPLYHCFGMVMGVLACTATGATMVFPCEGFEPGATLAAVAEERCTALHGVPTMFIAELDHPDFETFNLASLRTGIMAGSPCPIEVMKKVIARMGMAEVTIAYGMTETSPVSFQSATDDPLERRVSTVGRVQPHLEVKIVDGDGATVPLGQPGELRTRGYSVMNGYWDEPAKTADSIRGGWMLTGDLAVIDGEGFCNIVGRVKDMLIRGGENVYPREVEEFLFRHPAISQVQVFGVPDPKYGEEVAAWIILKAGAGATAEDIIAFCDGQIAHYKIPRHIRFVDTLPMTVTGKAQKFVMRDAMIKELGLSVEKTA